MNPGSIFFCGDLHGCFDVLIKAVLVHKPKATILLGDIQPKKMLHEELEAVMDITEFWYIHGNHETDSDKDYDNVFESKLKDRNLHGRVETVAGYKIAGLGGIFRGQVWLPPESPRYGSPNQFINECGKGNLWRGGLPRKHRSTIFPSVIEDMRLKQADILITHEAPHCHMHGSKAITNLGLDMGVKHMFHGHHHEQKTYAEFNKFYGLSAHAVGLHCITDLNGNTIAGPRIN